MPMIPTAAKAAAVAVVAARGAIARRFCAEQQQYLEYLSDRWRDEQEYEDIADYKTVIQQKAKFLNLTVLSMTKSPFGFVIQEPCGQKVKVKITTSHFTTQLIS